MMHFFCNICFNSSQNTGTIDFSEAELGLLGEQHLEIDVDESSTGRQVSSTTGFTTVELRDIHSLVRAAWLRVCGILLVSVLGLVAFISLVMLMKTMWYLSWMLFSAYGPLLWAVKRMCTQLYELAESACNVSLHVRASGNNRYLVQALSNILRQVALRGEAEVQVEVAEEEVTGASVYKLMLLPKTLKCSLCIKKGGKSHEIEIQSLHSDAVVCGPKKEVLYPTDFYVFCRATSMLSFFSLPIRSDSESLFLQFVSRQNEVMLFLQEWLGDIYIDYMRATVGMVEVLQLQKEFTDWAPEWREIRRERAVNRCVNASHCPSAYYSVQPWATQMLKHAEFGVRHKGRTRTCLFLHGTKGCGKTLFVEWLASELGLPIYHIDLRADFITDSVLRDSITPRKIRHNLPVIFHIDEFQSMMETWDDRVENSTEIPNPTNITIQGLQSVLEGIATPNHALFVFTGSRAVPCLDSINNQTLRHEWEGLLRRLPIRQRIPHVGKDIVEDFVINFLKPYLRIGTDLDIIRAKCQVLIDSWDVENTSVPLDMVAKYAEQQLRNAYVAGILETDNSGISMCVHPEQFQNFIRIFFRTEDLVAWPSVYAGGAHSMHLTH